MSRFPTVLTLAAATAALGACATSPSGATAQARGSDEYVVDAAKVSQVERTAQRYGIGLIWISQPLKRVPAAPGS